jgi:hypothetical protein
MSLLLLSGCTSDLIYRSDYKLCAVSAGNPCNDHSLQLHNGHADNAYMLGFVEIDDQGQLRDRHQLQMLLDTIYAEAAESSVLINVFVHGWHHNAAPGDRNIESFSTSLAKLSQLEHDLSQLKKRPARKVIGVYVGWRGESISVPVINNLTFWERKNTAQDVGLLGVSELLLKLEEVTNVKNASLTAPKSRLVIFGHSFGGAVVYTATSQILASRFVDSRLNKNYQGSANGFGDLVVLLNPAFEALRYAPFYDLAQARCSYFADQVPKLAILTSEADDATGLMFPAGRVFSTFFETHNTVKRNDCNHSVTLDEGEADRKTAGHYMPLISHTLKPAAQAKTMQAANYAAMKSIWGSQHNASSTQYGSTVLTHLGRTSPLNPYLNIRVSKELIANHNDVFGDQIMEFLRLLIVLSAADE